MHCFGLRIECLSLKLRYKQRRKILFDRFKMLIFMVLGFPLYIYGLINNYIPYTVPRWLAHKLKRGKSEIASTKLLAGIVMFLTYYGLEIFLFNYFINNNTYTLLYALSLVPSGNFALYYLFHVRRYRQHLRFFTIFYQKKTYHVSNY